MKELSLYKKLMLLALCDKRGTAQGVYLEYGLAAAILADLLLSERIRIDSAGNNKVFIVEGDDVADPILSEMLAKIKHKDGKEDLKHWVQIFAMTSSLRHKISEQLINDGIVELKKEKFLWLFTRRVYPEVNAEPEQGLRQQMRDAVLYGAEPDAQTALIMSLAKGAHLLDQVFEKEELDKYQDRIEEVSSGQALSEATKETIQAAEAAIMVAVMIPAIMAATTTATTTTCSPT